MEARTATALRSNLTAPGLTYNLELNVDVVDLSGARQGGRTKPGRRTSRTLRVRYEVSIAVPESGVYQCL